MDDLSVFHAQFINKSQLLNIVVETLENCRLSGLLLRPFVAAAMHLKEQIQICFLVVELSCVGTILRACSHMTQTKDCHHTRRRVWFYTTRQSDFSQ